MLIDKNVDKPLFVTVAVLAIGGLLILASASVALSEREYGTILYYTLHQLAYGGTAGLLALWLCMRVPYRFWRRWAFPLLIGSFLLMTLVFLPSIGFAAGGARRWIHLGPVTFQPSELLKLSFIIYLASWLDSRRHEVRSAAYGLAPFALMLAMVGAFLVMQPDVGTLGVIVLTAVTMYFLGGGKVAQMFALGVFGLAVLYLVVLIAPYRLSRIRVFLGGNADPQGAGYQMTQSLIGIGSGGFLGLGFGRGLQKYYYLPEPIGDSIFAIFAEELGFIGALFLIGTYCFLLWRGFVVAQHAPDMYGKLLAAGITVGIVLQAFINIAAISGLMPLTGITLPLVSYGGTSLIVTLASIGILLNISCARTKGGRV